MSGSPTPAPADGSGLRAIARLEALDGLRSRRQLVLRTLTPIVLFGVVLVVSLLTRSVPGTRIDPYVVAVQGDMTGAQKTLDGIGNGRLRFVPSTDATLDAARGADIGMLVPDGLDERMTQGRAADVVLLETALASESRAASALVRAGFGSLHQERAVQARGGSQTNQLAVDVIDVQRTTESARFQSAGLVAALLLLQASLLVGTTATRLLSRQNRGLLAAQLLLPFERWRLALSKGWAELLVGMIVAVPVLVVTVGLSIWTGVSGGGLGTGLVDTVAVLAAFTTLAVTMTGIGLLVGTAGRTQEQVSLISAVFVVLSAVIASQFALATPPPVLVTRLLPVVGVVQSLQGTLLGRPGDGWWLLVGISTTLALTAVLVRAAGRGFNAERLVLRDAG